MVERSLIGTVVVEQQEIIYANSRAAEIFGRPVDELVGMRAEQIVHPDDWQEGNVQLRQRMSGPDLSVFYALRAVRPDGSVRELETQTTWRTIDSRKMAVISIIDVTRRNKRVEKALEMMVDEWRRTFDAVNTPIIITRSDGSVVRANRAACELCALHEAVAIGKNVAELAPNEPWRTAARMVQYISDERSGTSSETRWASGASGVSAKPR